MAKLQEELAMLATSLVGVARLEEAAAAAPSLVVVTGAQGVGRLCTWRRRLWELGV